MASERFQHPPGFRQKSWVSAWDEVAGKEWRGSGRDALAWLGRTGADTALGIDGVGGVGTAASSFGEAQPWLQGKKPGRCGGSMRVRGGGVSRAPDRCTWRAAAAGRWGKRGARQGWAGATPRGKGWRCGLLPSLFAAGLRRTPLVAHFASSSAGRAGAGREWPRTPRPL